MEPFLQLVLAAFLGGIVGLEREHKGKEAGLRTYSMISLGAALFAIVSDFCCRFIDRNPYRA